MGKQLCYPPLPKPFEVEETQDVPESLSPSTSSTPCTPKTPRCPIRKPPVVWHHDQLAEIIHGLKDTILVALDFEMIDHPRFVKGRSESQKMSELGIAAYDPRDAASSSTYTIEERHQRIHVRHYIAARWRKTTPLTCNAFMRTTWPGKAGKIVYHVAHSYDGVFARSRIRTSLQIRNKLQGILNRLPTRCLTADEIALGQRRPVVLLFWDARLEVRIMSQWGIQIPVHEYPDPERTNIELWDLQKWHNLQQAKRNAETTDSAYNLLSPQGVLACGHTAGNDLFAMLAAFLYLLYSGEEAWTEYMTDCTFLSEEHQVKLDWVDPELVEYNQRLDPNWEGASCAGCFL